MDQLLTEYFMDIVVDGLTGPWYCDTHPDDLDCPSKVGLFSWWLQDDDNAWLTGPCYFDTEENTLSWPISSDNTDEWCMALHDWLIEWRWTRQSARVCQFWPRRCSPSWTVGRWDLDVIFHHDFLHNFIDDFYKIFYESIHYDVHIDLNPPANAMGTTIG